MKLNLSDQERNNEEQVINRNKDNTSRNINGKSEISDIANCVRLRNEFLKKKLHSPEKYIINKETIGLN